MNSPGREAASSAGTAQIQSIRVEGEGCIAMVDVDLLDANDEVTQRGHVVCLRNKAIHV
jgi:hypothetical protein